jgi:hypothetical protein
MNVFSGRGKSVGKNLPLNIVLFNETDGAQLVEAYFDESGSHDTSPVLCLADYIIEQRACEKLGSDWGEVLAKYKLPFSRMSCCAHGTGPFGALTIEDRISAEREIIAIVKRSITYGIPLPLSELARV